MTSALPGRPPAGVKSSTESAGFEPVTSTAIKLLAGSLPGAESESGPVTASAGTVTATLVPAALMLVTWAGPADPAKRTESVMGSTPANPAPVSVMVDPGA